MRKGPSRVVLCNGATMPNLWKKIDSRHLELDYRESVSNNPHVKLALLDFVRDVYHLPDRIRDLLEIAAYIYCADRLVFRGKKDYLEYHSWSRDFCFAIRVRDFGFWSRPTVKEKLKKALVYMSGDRSYQFDFQPGHSTPPADMFDAETFQIDASHDTKVILFSGGLDSLAGTVECLTKTSSQLCLVSHRSGQPGTAKTQDMLIKALQDRYRNRITNFKFRCGLRGIRAREETQRTRAFLYTSIAIALSHAYSQQEVLIYENGITSVNFPKRQDQMNSRISRTTHPQTIYLLEDFFSDILDSKVKLTTPYLWKTKTDIFGILNECGEQSLISSTVSCSRTFQRLSGATHCGGCSQCIDRRFAAYGSALDDIDEGGIYATDFIQNSITDDNVTIRLLDFVRQAIHFAHLDLDDFYLQMLNELRDLIDYVPGCNEEEKTRKIWELFREHGNQVERAILRMRDVHDTNVYGPLPSDSFLQMISTREYLLPESIPTDQEDPSMHSQSQTKGMDIFCAYSHEDEELRNQLGNHLSSLERQKLIKVWHDRKIGPGKEWEEEIDENINTARIILLLVSSDFISSDYCYNVEMRRAMERHEAEDARVIPIMLRPVDWEGTPFSKLQALPRDAKSVTDWVNQDKAFARIAKEIRGVVDELNETYD